MRAKLSADMRIMTVAALGLCVSLAACGGGSKKSSVRAGNDQASTPFCQTLSKLDAISDPKAHAADAQALITQAAGEAPASLVEGTKGLALFLPPANGGTTTTLSAADLTRVGGELRDLDTYQVAHCGIVLRK